MRDFHQAMDRVIAGLEKRSKVLTTKERSRVAHHEAGHAVVGWFLEHAAPLLKVSIVPRGMAALGYAQYVPKERKLHTRQQMLDQMCMMLGGRIAEQIFFDKVSTGAQDDLQKVTRLAYGLVTVYGMSDKIGHLSFQQPQDGQINSQRPYSEAIAECVDEEVRQIVWGAYDRTLELLESKKELAAALAARLLEKEVILRADVIEILGERPFKDAMSYEEIVGGIAKGYEAQDMPTPEEEAEVEDVAGPAAPEPPPAGAVPAFVELSDSSGRWSP